MAQSEPASPAWPTDPAVAERLRWIAHYAVLGWSAERIAAAVKAALPYQAQKISGQSIRADLKRLMGIWRSDTLGDVSDLFVRLSMRLDHVAVQALEEYRASVAPRVAQGPNGSYIVPPADQSQRTQLLNTVIRATTAQAVLNFGKNGVPTTINVDARQQSVQIGEEAALALREQVGEMRRLLAGSDQQAVIPTTAGRAKTRPTKASPGDRAFQKSMDAVIRSQGATGNLHEPAFEEPDDDEGEWREDEA